MDASVEKNGDCYKLELSFNIRRLHCFYYEPLIFKDFLDSIGHRKVDSIINCGEDINKVSESLRHSLLVLENSNGKRKVFKVEYNIINGRLYADLSMLFYEKYLVEMCYPKYSRYDLSKDIYSLNALKVTKGDKKVRFLYVYGDQIKMKKRVLFSNWIDLDGS